MDCSWDTLYFLSQSINLPETLTNKIQYGKKQEFITALAEAALIPDFTAVIFAHFETISLELCARWATYDLYATAAAFARILPVLPHLADVALQIFSSGSDLDLLSGLKDEDDQDCRDQNRSILLAVFRLLNFDNDKFARFIRPAKLQWYLQHDDRSLRYLAVRVICQYMHASDAVLEDMKSRYLGSGPAFGMFEKQITIDFEFLSLWENQRLAKAKGAVNAVRDLRKNASSRAKPVRVVEEDDLSDSVALVAGVLLHRSTMATTNRKTGEDFVATSTTQSNLRTIAGALANPHPLLLTGLAGCGKTFLVRHIAERLNKSSSMITLHLNEQSDAKLLIGIYTTGSQPGSFEWQPGVLTTAVSEGRWVLIEDLDRAPAEVMSTLLPLIERGELSVPSRGQKIIAAPGFKLIATMRSTVNLRGDQAAPTSRLLGKRFWRMLLLDAPEVQELRDIILAQYPLVTPLIDQIMAVYSQLANGTILGLESSRSQLKDRPISPRELLKWAGRINAVLQRRGLQKNNDSISEDTIDSIFLDAVDCFAGYLEEAALRIGYISVIAKELHIDPQRRQYLVSSRSVSFTRSKTDHGRALRIGRAVWTGTATNRNATINQASSTFAINGHSLRLLERVAVAVERREPLLLVGETGIGKTATIQHLSHITGNKLVAINLSQQSEAGDLLGGFKPVNIRSMAIPLKDEFDSLFERLFSQKKNHEFSQQLSKCLVKSQWKRAVTLWRAALKKVDGALLKDGNASPRTNEQQIKRRKINPQFPSEIQSQYESFSRKLDAFERQLLGPTNAFQFSFVEGKLITAVREGHWVLLDEINLASSDTLECLSELLDSHPNARPSIILAETGDVERIFAHPNFRVFAAMNPANDVGKKDLPLGIRSRFTEIFVDSPDGDFQSLRDIARVYMERLSAGNAEHELATKVAELFQQIQSVVREEGLVDGSGEAAHFSLRTLTRALAHASVVTAQCSIRRAIYEGFCLCFFTCLDAKCEARLQQLVKSGLFVDNTTAKAELKKSLRPPQPEEQFAIVLLRDEAAETSKKKPREEKHWLPTGQLPLEDPSHYIITPYVKHNLQNLIRASFTRKYPVLIQGPTSAGKTSMIEYLAKRSGNKFVRINNHEHTDLQEYLGTYVSTAEGNLIFQEGVLVQAVRQGHWIVLDELNLAPTDVLEALNRLLDDNRELMIPETQEVIKAHRNFTLFATQNPAGPYGGRKVLSKAFRNRFVELHFDDIPVEELNVILARRSNLPESWCGLIVEVYKRLSTLRQEQRLFEENSFATLRDLFRWAFRGADTIQELAAQGYMLLAEKVRKADERLSIKSIIEQTMTRKGVKVQIDDGLLYNSANCPEMEFYNQSFGANILWTKAMRRLFVLISHAIRHGEPVLLVGETGCGKTTVCQMLAKALGKELHIVNAHQNTETGDLIGAQRPIRNRAAIDQELLLDLRRCLSKVREETDYAAKDIDSLFEIFDTLEKDELEALMPDVLSRIVNNRMKRKALFEWSDGSLVQAMRSGAFYLLDEISLAEDSVLERMNSVLDPQRSLLLAEKGSNDPLVIAQEGFQFFATMNPGGDFGKKELSPALRNRFTEIWVPPLSDAEDVSQIVEERLMPEARHYSAGMVGFSKWFSERYNSFKFSNISIRDLLAWVEFINSQPMSLLGSVVHGAAMVYIDTLGANPSAFLEITGETINLERDHCIHHLGQFLGQDVSRIFIEHPDLQMGNDFLRVGHFSINCATKSVTGPLFHFETPTTKLNAMRILRALQLVKPILLEGSPGVGKTSIITAIANTTGRDLTRINLSDQTDLMDLFGSDVPVENAEAGTFSWRDAPFLTAMKRGDWVLLDEMNLASQSILEGLNACLDHRGEAYIAELDQTFTRHPNFRLFAAQNPHHQGGGRKGLPTSFVNRFTVVYVDSFKPADLQLICARGFPSYTSSGPIGKLIEFVSELASKVTSQRKFGARGAPWEFNLRDILRWLQLLTSQDGLLPAGTPEDYLDMLFAQRFRTNVDMQSVRTIFGSTFDQELSHRNYFTNISYKTAQIGLALLPRRDTLSAQPSVLDFKLKPRIELMESLMLCVQHNWPVVLVGSSGAGKSSLLKALASISGAELEIFALNADIDATDLVGGFEQVDVSRQIQTLLQDLQRFCIVQCRKLFLSNPGSHHAIAIEKLLELISNIRSNSGDHSGFLHLKGLFNQYLVLVPSDEGALISQQLQSLSSKPRTIGSAMFEWVDGTLVKALESGCWLVLDNANLCSSSVLDRINSLLEPDGSLIINEHCDEDGNAKLIKPHPNFRIFMTVDHQYGELSRAMRNRAVELFVPDISVTAEKTQEESASYIEVEPSMAGFQSILNLSNAKSNSHSFDVILEKSLERLSTKNAGILSRFAQQAALGLISVDRMEIFDVTSKRLEFWTQADGAELVSSKFYKVLQDQLQLHNDFDSSQPCHILVNQPLVAYGRVVATQFDTVWLGRLQNILQDLARMGHTLASANTPAASPKEITRLQRSFKTSRTANTFKESTYSVASFLKNVQMALFDWVKISWAECSVDHGFLRVVSSIKSFWWAIFLLVSSTNFDEASFRTLVMLGSRVVAKARPITQGDTSLVKKAAQQFEGFGQAIQLITGFSMEQLWKLFRPNTVPSFERLQSLLQLENLGDRFDKYVWQIHAPFEEITELRRSIVGAIELAYQQQVKVDSISKGLDDALANLRIDEQYDDISIQPFFRGAFEYIIQLLDIRVACQPSNGDSQTLLHTSEQLHLLACRSTKSTRQNRGISVESTLSRLSNFWQTSANADQAAPPIADLGMHILQRLQTSDDVTLRRLGMLQVETNILGNEIGGKSDVLGVTVLPWIFFLLSDLVQALLLQHQDVLNPQFVERIMTYSLRSVLKDIADIDDFIQQVFSSPDSKEQSDLQSLFSRLIQCFSVSASETDWSSSMALQHLSRCFITFSLVSLLLYVPDKIFDPAMRNRMELQIYEQRRQSLQEKRDAHVFIEQFFTGKSSNFQLSVCEDEIEGLGSAPPVLEIARPPRSRIDEIQVDFSSVVRLVKLVYEAESEGQHARLEDPVLIGNVSAMVKRLSNSLNEYRDLTEPAAKFLKCLKIGLNMSELAREQENRKDNPTVAILQQPLLASLPGLSLEIQPTSIILSGTSQHLPLELRIIVLQSYALRSSIQSPTKWPSGFQEDFTSVIFSLFVDWKSQLAAEQKKSEAESSFYRYRGGQEDAEDEQERQFNNLFPSFTEDSLEIDSSSDGRHGNSAQKLASTIASILTAVFLEQSDPVKQSEQIIEQASSLMGKNQTQISASKEVFNAQKIFPILFLRIQHKKLELRSEIKSSPSYNFYVDRNILEAQRLANFVYDVQERFHSILQIWPEHATLHNVLSVCKELLNFRHVEPVMKFLTKAEQLHDYIAEWQSVASREFSAEQLFNKLTDILVSWRQLELSTWAKLLELETEKCVLDAQTWWFIAYENVCAIPESLQVSPEEMQLHAAELIGVLESFLVASSLGQFQQKLKILQSLLALINLSLDHNPSIRPIHNALGNFIDYFIRFVPAVRSRIMQGRQPLEKQLKDVLLLASWKDRNIAALKQSAKSSHRKLFRVVRKYRDLLSQPIHELLNQEIPFPEASEPNNIRAAGVDEISLVRAQNAAKICQQEPDHWQNLPQRLRNVTSTCSVMQDKAKIDTDVGLMKSAPRLESFVDNLEGSVNQLRTETPSTLTDDNASLVKHLLARKRRLFADTLKEIRQMGMTSNPSRDVLGGQNSLGAALSSITWLESSDFPADLRDAQDFLHSTINEMSRVRQAISDHHDDISKSELSRSIGCIESLLALNVRQRNIYSSQKNHMHAFELMLLQAKNVWSYDGPIVQPIDRFNAVDVALITKLTMWLPSKIRLSVKMLSAQAELANLEFSEIIEELSKRADSFGELQKAHLELPVLPPKLFSEKHTLILGNCRTAIESFVDLLRHWIHEERYKTASVVLSQLESWISSQNSDKVTSFAAESNLATLEPSDFDQTVSRAVDMVLGAIQDVENVLASLKQRQETEKEWLIRHTRDLESLIKSFHSPAITQAFEDILPLIYRTGISSRGYIDERLVGASAMLTLVLPVFEKYHELAAEALYRYAALHRATCRATYRLAKIFTVIATQGFCRPAESSGEQGAASEKLESGTGLGEGEGAEDISKDIGEDEDLSELAQDPENRKADGDMKNEDDAVDIEDALEGAAADDTETKEGEGDRFSEGEDEASGSDIESQDGSVGGGEGGAEEQGADAQDDEVGDVDDFGPSAVDEKLWDQAADEDKKTKEGKQSSENVDKDDQAAATDEKKTKDAEGKEERDGEGVDEGSDIEMSDDSDHGSAGDDGAMDPHVKESEGFELPEDLQLDGDKGDQDDVDAEDSDEELLNQDGDADPGVREQQEDTADLETEKENGPTDSETAQDEQQQEQDGTEQKEKDEDVDMDGETRPEADDSLGDQDATDANEGAGGVMANDSAENTNMDENETTIQGVGPDQTMENETTTENAAQRQAGIESQAADQPQTRSSEGTTKGQESAPRESRDSQTVRKLGSMFEQWHRQQREIHESSSDNKENERGQEDVDMGEAEFEHLPDEDTRADTQALGAANEEQARALDDSMAIPRSEGEKQESRRELLPDMDEGSEDLDVDEEMDDRAPTSRNQPSTESQTQAGAFVGERKERPVDQVTDDVESEDLEQVDDQLSTMQLQPSDKSPDRSQSPMPASSDALVLWNHHESRTHTLSLALTSHLRLILAPTLATKLRGDFRTGKRLNIKRIIPYIASSYKRDKIWMRRSVPTKRAYQVMLAIDDSRSMVETAANDAADNSKGQSSSKDMAFDTLALISRGLSMLDVGEISVVGFGEKVFVAHDFGSPLTSEAGADVLRHFMFQQQKTDVKRLVQESIEIFREARMKSTASSSAELWQLELIVSDGICEDHEGIRRLLLQAREERIMIVFVIVDALVSGASGKGQGQGQGQSIVDLERVEFVAGRGAEGNGEDEGEMRVVRTKYLESFPFAYYLVVKDVKELPQVLATALRQWFAEVAER